jgi:hypothetical protein
MDSALQKVDLIEEKWQIAKKVGWKEGEGGTPPGVANLLSIQELINTPNPVQTVR